MTGQELDRSVLRELSVLESQNAEGVAQHLVMAMQYLNVDPEFAFQHAQAAVRRGGRVAAVREAAGVAAYVAEHFDVALRELRTHRRMSGSAEHLAMIADSERALGRTEKALETAADPVLAEQEPSVRVEVAMVVSGIHQDQGDLKAARAALEIPELNRQRAYSYSPRLFGAYADVLDALGESKEAESWARLAVVAEAALGQGQFEEPEIYEIDVLPDEEPEVPAGRESNVDGDHEAHGHGATQIHDGSAASDPAGEKADAASTQTAAHDATEPDADVDEEDFAAEAAAPVTEPVSTTSEDRPADPEAGETATQASSESRDQAEPAVSESDPESSDSVSSEAASEESSSDSGTGEAPGPDEDGVHFI